eukprot:3926348-Pyramimonas_sp.AAC.1
MMLVMMVATEVMVMIGEGGHELVGILVRTTVAHGGGDGDAPTIARAVGLLQSRRCQCGRHCGLLLPGRRPQSILGGGYRRACISWNTHPLAPPATSR